MKSRGGGIKGGREDFGRRHFRELPRGVLGSHERKKTDCIGPAYHHALRMRIGARNETPSFPPTCIV